ncbi:MAG: hypothetical protein GXY49_12960 [Syntrophomonadaceae bacterium]|nr:hypothetical protein [Syntrophomonadaceae bacterium]
MDLVKEIQKARQKAYKETVIKKFVSGILLGFTILLVIDLLSSNSNDISLNLSKVAICIGMLALIMTCLQMTLPSTLLKDDIKNLIIFGLLRGHDFQIQDDDQHKLLTDILYKKYNSKIWRITTASAFITGGLIGIIFGFLIVKLFLVLNML